MMVLRFAAIFVATSSAFLSQNLPPSSRASRKIFSSSGDETDVVVVGSGVSGCCLAHHLARQGASVVLTEARNDVGGNLISRSNEDGYIWEEGPNSFQPTPIIMRTAYEAGIADQLVLADKSLPPWVFFEGKLRPLPKNLPGDLLNFDLLSWPGKIRAGLGAVGLWLGKPPSYEESIEDFVTRHLGEETFQRIIDPFVSGVYAGDPKKLSMRSALRKIYRLQQLSINGALVPGALVRFQEIAQEKRDNPPDPRWPTYQSGELGSFKRGLKTLADAICAGLDSVRTSWKLLAIKRVGDRWLLEYDTPQGPRSLKANAVACTAPAHAIGDIVRPLSETCATALDSVYYPPVASVTVSYPKSAFYKPDLPGFGNLNPRSQKVRTLGTIWSSSLFPGRCPPTHNLLLNYIGGSRDVGIADLSEREILDQVDADLRKTLLKPDAPPPNLLGMRLWPKAIPQYEKQHKERVLDQIDAFEQDHPGLYLGGNYRTGVAFGDCVQYGFDEAGRILDYLDRGAYDASSERGAAKPGVKAAAPTR